MSHPLREHARRFGHHWEGQKRTRWIVSATYVLLVFAFPIDSPGLELLAIFTGGLVAILILVDLLRSARTEFKIPKGFVLGLCVLGATGYLAELRLGQPVPNVLRFRPVGTGMSGSGSPTHSAGVPMIELPAADSSNLLLVAPSDTNGQPDAAPGVAAPQR